MFIDPKSRLDPTPILDRWRNLIDIKVLTRFEDHMGPYHIEEFEKRSASWKFVYSQVEFYRYCAIHHKSMNRTWTVFSDTDEFLAPRSDRVPNVTERLKHPGMAWDLIHEAHENPQNHNSKLINGVERDCITLGRTNYLSFESPESEVALASTQYTWLDPFRFQTLRFRYSSKRHVVGKSIVDVSKYKFSKVPHGQLSPHKMLKDCVRQWGNPGDWMHFNHYFGSWEAFQRPGDSRSVNRQLKWYELNQRWQNDMDNSRSQEARNWLEGFLSDVGESQAKYLLADVGYAYNQSSAMEPTANITKLIMLANQTQTPPAVKVVAGHTTTNNGAVTTTSEINVFGKRQATSLKRYG